jgi:hypothetical protein
MAKGRGEDHPLPSQLLDLHAFGFPVGKILLEQAGGDVAGLIDGL